MSVELTWGTLLGESFFSLEIGLFFFNKEESFYLESLDPL